MDDKQLIKIIDAWGVDNADACVRAAHQNYRPTLPRCLAMLEMESGGRNVFGGDPWNSEEYPKGPALPDKWHDTDVNWIKYESYKHKREQGLQPNGVGPTQLTSVFLQVAADKKGGCDNPLPNMEVGFAYLHGLILRAGDPWAGARDYNGSGPAAESYANNFMLRAEAWERRLK